MARVTGIGGVFLKARDPKTLAAWYAEFLGIQIADYGGATLLWSDEVPAGTGQTAWMLFPDATKHFGDPVQRAMINYRVDDLEAILTKLRAANVPIDPKQESASYGHFAWITDPEGNRVRTLATPRRHTIKLPTTANRRPSTSPFPVAIPRLPS